jgi:hypothetical protein
MYRKLTESEKATAKYEEERKEEVKRNPLIRYSKSQLKAELQRRKREWK